MASRFIEFIGCERGVGWGGVGVGARASERCASCGESHLSLDCTRQFYDDTVLALVLPPARGGMSISDGLHDGRVTRAIFYR